jgi:hypothetical protein
LLITVAYIIRRNLNGILAAVMLESDISQETLPKETSLESLGTFMEGYGTRKMHKDQIIGYLKRLDETMNHVPIPKSIRSELSLDSGQRKRINVLSIGERTPLFRIHPS